MHGSVFFTGRKVVDPDSGKDNLLKTDSVEKQEERDINQREPTSNVQTVEGSSNPLEDLINSRVPASSGRDPLLTSKEDTNRVDEPIDFPLRRNSIVSVSQVIVIARNEGDEFGPEAQQSEKDNIHKAIDKMKRVR